MPLKNVTVRFFNNGGGSEGLFDRMYRLVQSSIGYNVANKLQNENNFNGKL